MDINKTQKRYRLFQIVEVGASSDFISRFYDFVSTGILVLNLIISVMYTFEDFATKHHSAMWIIELVTVLFFTADYVMRLATAKCGRPDKSEGMALLRYVVSFVGLVDLLSFLPFYLPFFFPAGVAVFRVFRVIRIFRLFQLNAYYDSLNVIADVLNRKKQQLISSIFIIWVLMLAASLCMYSIEHPAQPEVFKNAFSGIWWSVSTLLTVGYGDIYPITTAGRAFSIVITFLGVLMVGIPTGIISAGFVEQYSQYSQLGDYTAEDDMNFVQVEISPTDYWVGKPIVDMKLPSKMIVALIVRKQEIVVPNADAVVKAGDILIFGADTLKHTVPLDLKTVSIGPKHDWNGTMIRNLDISRLTYILMVRRGGKILIPHGDLVILENDELVLYTKKPRKSDTFDEKEYLVEQEKK